MTEEFPGLLSSNIRLTGKYGIGFFSVFMLGDAVRVRTRRADAAQNETVILEFNTGLSTRPIIRPASKDEYIRDGGTCVRVWLKRDPESMDGLLGNRYTGKPDSLRVICGLIGTSLDVNLRAGGGSNNTVVVSGSDWITVDGRKLLSRLSILNKRWSPSDVKLDKELISYAAKNLRLIRNPDGEIVGRACITVPHLGLGALTVGGLFASELIGIGGVLVGTPERAARDLARPMVTKDVLMAWATEQADLVPQLHSNISSQKRCAQMIRQLGGHTRELPIAMWRDKYVSYVDLLKEVDLPDELIFVFPYSLEKLEDLEGFSVLPNVLFVEFDGYQGMVTAFSFKSTWPDDLFNSWGYGMHSMEHTLGGAVVDALAEKWQVTAPEILSASAYDAEAEDKVVFGHVNNKAVKEWGIIIRRPHRTK